MRQCSLEDTSCFTPPVAPIHEHREEWHGEAVTDNYFWLREKSNPEVARYLEAENAYTAALTKDIKPFEDALYAEMLGRIKQTDLSVPARRSGYLYYARTEEGKQYPIRCRRKGSMEAREEVLLDPNELAAGRPFVGIGNVAVSDDSNLLAYTVDFTGFRQYTLGVKDLRTGEMFTDAAERVTSVIWAADNRTLFYVTEDAITKRPDKLWRRLLGAAEYEEIYYEKDELYDIAVEKTRDRRMIVLGIESKDTSECHYLRADRPNDPLAVFLPREKAHRYYIDHREGEFFIRTNRGGRNFEVKTAPENSHGPENWKTFVAHDENVRIQEMDLFRDFAVVIERTDAIDRLRLYNYVAGAWQQITFPEPVYAASAGG